MSIFAKARAGANLSPAQRALLKLIEGFAIAGVVAALPVLALALGQESVNWTAVGRVALGTFSTAALMAAVKYLKAQGDAPLTTEPQKALAAQSADVLTTVASQVANWAGVNDVGNKPAAPVVALTVPPMTSASVTTT